MSNYRYIIRNPDGSTSDVFASNLKSLLTQAYRVVRNWADAKAQQAQIKQVIEGIRDADKFVTRTNKELAKEKIDRQKAIALLAKQAATSNQNEDPYEDTGSDLDDVLATKKATNKPRSHDWAYMKAWREKRKAELAMDPAALAEAKLIQKQELAQKRAGSLVQKLAVIKEQKKALLKSKPGCYASRSYMSLVKKQKKIEAELASI